MVSVTAGLMWAPERFPQGETVIAVAVSPIPMPRSSRRSDSFDIHAWAGEAGYSSKAVHRQAESMKTPRPQASMRYFGQLGSETPEWSATYRFTQEPSFSRA